MFIQLFYLYNNYYELKLNNLVCSFIIIVFFSLNKLKLVCISIINYFGWHINYFIDMKNYLPFLIDRMID